MSRFPAMMAVALSLPAVLAAADEQAPGQATCTPAERSSYLYRVRQAIVVNWAPPRRAAGFACTVVIAQNFRGEVLDAGAGDCPDDPLVRKSVEDAAYLASPLPLPGNRACFEAELRIRLIRRDEPAA